MFTPIGRSRWPLALVLAIALPVSIVNAQAPNAGEAMVTRVYAVYDLVMPTRNYPYPSSNLPSVGEQGVRSYDFGLVGGMGGFGGFGGGMGGYGGGGGGGGFFAVPDQMRVPSHTVLPQLGGGGGVPATGAPAAGGSGGSGGTAQNDGGGISSPRSRAGNPLHFSMDDLIGTIVSIIDPDSWDSMGGPASIEALGGTLIVANRAVAHEQIEAILESLREVGGMHRNVTIEAHWLQITSDQLQLLTQGQSAGRVDPEQLKRMLGTPSLRYQGQVTCLNGQTVYTVSGDRHTAITTAIPVVGGTEVGYQPIREIPNAGVLLQTTALVLPGGDGVLVDVQSTVTEWRDVIPRRLGTIEIDCPVIAAQQLATAVQMKLGAPQLVGGLTVVDAKNPAAAPGHEEQAQLYLVLKVESPGAAE
ncbi:MAG: hypothetical protein ACC628_11545 [Pirellulaceae bacterium]